MLVEPRALVRRLTPTATRLLEASVGRAANSRAYEIVVEHLLSTMLEDERGVVRPGLRVGRLGRELGARHGRDGSSSSRAVVVASPDFVLRLDKAAA